MSDTRSNDYRLASCEGKISFVSARQAIQAAKRRAGRIIYRCKFCPYFHTGTPDAKVKKFHKRNKLIKIFLQTEWCND